LPLSNRLLKELGDYRRAQRQGKRGYDIPWLFLGYRAEPICTTTSQFFGLAPALNDRQAGTRIVAWTRPSVRSECPGADERESRRQKSTYTGSFEMRIFSHSASRRNGVQLLPSLKSKRKFRIKGGAAWLETQIS
jgi:hypothetical protein